MLSSVTNGDYGLFAKLPYIPLDENLGLHV